MRVHFGWCATAKKENKFSKFCKNYPGRKKTLGAWFHFYDQLFELFQTFFITFCSRSLRLSAILIFHFRFSSCSYNFFHIITYQENAKKRPVFWFQTSSSKTDGATASRKKTQKNVFFRDNFFSGPNFQKKIPRARACRNSASFGTGRVPNNRLPTEELPVINHQTDTLPGHE